MITADYVTGRLAWNTAAIDSHVVREVKGKGPKKPKPKPEPAVDTSGLVHGSVGKTSISDLDTLVGSMAAHETIPTGSGARRGKGDAAAAEEMAKYRHKTIAGYSKKPEPRYDATRAELDKLAAKYAKSPSGLLMIKKRVSRK